ncbi:MAG: hemerythrin domain-containing protein [Rhizobacter sp.]|nr:hemerythrin domain-containing protein [Rhizobacter sp.]
MPTTSTHTRKSTSSKASSASRAPDALKLLAADHKEVKALFKEYQKLCEAEADGERKQALAEQICDMLTVHATIEEELLYPAARDVLDEADLVDEATVEHASAKELIAQIQGMQPADELYDAKVTVLGEYIDHHVKEEEKEMFPKLRKSELDLKELGVSLQTRKSELMGEADEMPPVH